MSFIKQVGIIPYYVVVLLGCDSVSINPEMIFFYEASTFPNRGFLTNIVVASYKASSYSEYALVSYFHLRYMLVKSWFFVPAYSISLYIIYLITTIYLLMLKFLSAHEVF